MRQVTQSTWECTECGATVWVERGRKPLTIFMTTSRDGTERVVVVEWQEVHRCQPDGHQPT
jgi:hypothetical protein